MKLHWSDLTEEQKTQVGIGCGPGKVAFFIPQFIFKASCVQHDFYYNRGGYLFEKIEADLFFYAFMLSDINQSNFHWLRKTFYLICASVYFLLVSTFGLLGFTWGRYRTLEEVVVYNKTI